MPNLADWTREEEKAFENGIALHMSEQLNEEWEKIASLVPTKSVEEIREHYQVLVEDVNAIESGKVALPDYGNGNGKGNEEALLSSSSKENNHSQSSKEQKGNSNQGNGFAGFGASSMGNSTKASKLEQERKKGIPWTEEEHRLFLLGLDKFGKGDWRSISRNYVITRTPTQVASHAQKYFIRLNSMNRDRRRSSIHDITSVNGAGLSTNQAPITGQNPAPTQAVGGAVAAAAAAAAANKHRAQSNGNIGPGIGMYGTHMGHPVTGAPVPPLVPPHMGSAVGTPLMLPPPGHRPHHPHYAVPMAYPMAPPPMHR